MENKQSKVKLFFKYLLLVIEYLITAAYIIVMPLLSIVIIAIDEPQCWSNNSCPEEISTKFIVNSALLILLNITFFALLVQSIWLTHRAIHKNS